MKAYAITLNSNLVSVRGTENLINSSKAFGNDFEIETFSATRDDGPATLAFEMGEWGFKWNYPWDVPVRDIASGLLKSPYRTANPGARVACALSHYRLWNAAVQMNETILVLEHDAIFTQKLTNGDIKLFEDSRFIIAGINDPRGATRKSDEFHDNIQFNKRLNNFIDSPTIDAREIPQGLAGNSAYLIKPAGGKKMLELVKEYGLWPNDAIMCRQLVPSLGVSTKYYTKVQGLPSTTT